MTEIVGLDDNENQIIHIKYDNEIIGSLPRKWLFLSRLWKTSLEQDSETTEINVDSSIVHLETLKKIIEWLEIEKGVLTHYGLSSLEFLDPKDKKEQLEREENKYGFITTQPSEDELEEETKEVENKYRGAVLEEYVDNPEWLKFLKSLQFKYEDLFPESNFHLVFQASSYFDIPTLLHLCARLLAVKICGVPEWDIPIVIQRKVSPDVEETLKQLKRESEEEEKTE